jgi:SagB-type dehydrogenase family enzyme
MKKIITLLPAILFSCFLFGQGLKPVTLNPPDLKRGLTVMEALSLRASNTDFSDKKLSLQDLSDLLFAANGVNRKDLKKRTAPSAMNAQDIDVYVFLQEGVYIYDAFQGVLNPIVAGDQRLLAAGSQENVAKAPVILLMVSDISRFRLSEAMKLENAAKDAGIVSQNINIFCAGTGLITRTRGSMDLVRLKSVLNLKDTQHPMLNNPVGYPLK